MQGETVNSISSI